MKDVNKLRIDRLTRRFDERRRPEPSPADPAAAFEAEFERVRRDVLVPLLHEIGVELSKAGHDYAVTLDADRPAPSVAFRVVLNGAKPGNKNSIGFFVQHQGLDGKSEVIPYLELKNVFDLGRFQDLSEMNADTLEQMLVDGLEHMMACNEG